MKLTLLHLTIFFSLFTFAQDTLSISPRYDGGMTYLIKTKTDTFFINTYSDGSIESKRMSSNKKSNLYYVRYYPNGKIMWEKSLKNGKTNELAKYYNSKGKKVAEFMYKDGQITDTLYLSKKDNLLFGRMTYYSIVHGGMERVDGGSNISGGHGIYMHYPMYIVKLDSTIDEQEIYLNFQTDYDGNFFLCLEKGTFGFFPKTYPIAEVKVSMGAPLLKSGGGWSANWSIEEPLKIETKSLQFLDLHYHSVGYAP